jgi:hypothetical protein
LVELLSVGQAGYSPQFVHLPFKLLPNQSGLRLLSSRFCLLKISVKPFGTLNALLRAHRLPKPRLRQLFKNRRLCHRLPQEKSRLQLLLCGRRLARPVQLK